MSKILKIGNSALAALLAVLGIIFTIIAIGDPNSFLGGLAFRVAYVLIALCTIVAVGAFIILLVTNFKKYYMVLVWIALMAITYFFAGAAIFAIIFFEVRNLFK